MRVVADGGGLVGNAFDGQVFALFGGISGLLDASCIKWIIIWFYLRVYSFVIIGSSPDYYNSSKLQSFLFFSF